MRLLRDFRPHGAVYEVARKCEAACKAQKVKRIDFSNPARRKEVRAELLVLPACKFNLSNPRQAQLGACMVNSSLALFIN